MGSTVLKASRKGRRSWRSDAGVTLLELAFAAGVMSIGILMLTGALVTVTHQSRIGNAKAIATTLNEGVLESLRGRSLEEILTFNQDGTELNTNDSGHLVIEGFEAQGPATLNVNFVDTRDGGMTRHSIPMSETAIDALGDLPNPIEVEVHLTVDTGDDDDYTFRTSTLVHY